ncbi:MAG: hypothetical protein ACRC14_02640 [Paracoccaceae bacterium]
MKLVSNWKSAWRWWSMRFASLAIAWEAAWLALPPDVMASLVSPEGQGKVTAVLMVAAMIGRLIDQGTAKA